MSSDDTRKAVTFFWPDPMTPVNALDRPLIRDALSEAQASVAKDRRRGHGCGALVCIRAKGGVILPRDSHEGLLR